MKLEAHLGENVYATYDGYHVILDRRAQGSERIALDPSVFEELVRFRSRAIAAEREEARKIMEGK